MEISVKSRLLDGLNAADLAVILRAAKVQRFHANSVIVHQAAAAEHLFLLTHGYARHFFITDGGQKILMRWLVPGDITGAATLLSEPSHYLMGTETVKESRFLAWDRSTVMQLVARYPKFLHNSLFLFEIYFEWYITAQVALTCDSPRRRCAFVLMNIAHAVGRKVDGGIELTITNEELASAAGIALYDASRFVNEWQRSGLLVKTRGKVLLLSLELFGREI